MMPSKIPCGEINRNCTLNNRCAYFCKEDSQFEDDELNTERSDVKLHEFHFKAQKSWAEIWNVVSVDASLILNNTMLSEVLWSKQWTCINARRTIELCI